MSATENEKRSNRRQKNPNDETQINFMVSYTKKSGDLKAIKYGGSRYFHQKTVGANLQKDERRIREKTKFIEEISFFFRNISKLDRGNAFNYEELILFSKSEDFIVGFVFLNVQTCTRLVKKTMQQ